MLTMVTHGSNQTLHYTLWNVLPLMLQFCKKLQKCLGWLIPPALHADPVHPDLLKKSYLIFFNYEGFGECTDEACRVQYLQ